MPAAAGTAGGPRAAAHPAGRGSAHRRRREQRPGAASFPPPSLPPPAHRPGPEMAAGAARGRANLAPPGLPGRGRSGERSRAATCEPGPRAALARGGIRRDPRHGATHRSGGPGSGPGSGQVFPSAGSGAGRGPAGRLHGRRQRQLRSRRQSHGGQKGNRLRGLPAPPGPAAAPGTRPRPRPGRISRRAHRASGGVRALQPR